MKVACTVLRGLLLSNEEWLLDSVACHTPCTFHAGVNQSHYIEACVLTNRFEANDQQVLVLLEQIDEAIDHFTGDGAFDKTPVYEAVLHHSPNADVVIPPSTNAVEKTKAAPMRNRNIQEITEHGRKIEIMGEEISVNLQCFVIKKY